MIGIWYDKKILLGQPSQRHSWRNNVQLLSPQKSLCPSLQQRDQRWSDPLLSLSRCLGRASWNVIRTLCHQVVTNVTKVNCCLPAVFFGQAAIETCFCISIVYKLSRHWRLGQHSRAEIIWRVFVLFSFFYFYSSICFYCSGQAGESSVEIRWGVLGLWDTRLQGGEATAWTTQSPLITSPSQPRPSSNCLSMEPSCSVMSLVEFCNFRWWLQWTWL